jgi:hypothetical protein
MIDAGSLIQTHPKVCRLIEVSKNITLPLQIYDYT